MAEVARATVGDEAYLFHEQWVVKGAEQGMKFAWHQDSGYVKWYDPKTNHKPYVTCWCTLDDVSEENGTVYLLPHSRGGTRGTIIDHFKEEGTNDLIGYTGSDPGDAIIVPAGSIVAFDSMVFHRCGPNKTENMRRIYLPQYSAAPILRPDGTAMGHRDAISEGRQEYLQPRGGYEGELWAVSRGEEGRCGLTREMEGLLRSVGFSVARVALEDQF